MESKEPASNGNGTDITEGLKEGDEMGIWYDLASAPCFRQSLLYGLGGGGAIGALNLLRNRMFLQLPYMCSCIFDCWKI